MHGFFQNTLLFTTMVHGDFWANNMMFRHDDKGEPASVKFIDLQVICMDGRQLVQYASVRFSITDA